MYRKRMVGHCLLKKSQKSINGMRAQDIHLRAAGQRFSSKHVPILTN
jgi:hypothetical protein